MTCTKVLWVSRHPLIDAEKKALYDLFGCVYISWYNGYVRDVEHLESLAKGFDVLAAVLPLSLLRIYIERNKPVLFPIMRSATGDELPDYVVPTTNEGKVFVKWVWLKGVELVMDEVS